MRAEGVAEVAIDSFVAQLERLRNGETGVLAESEIEPVAELPDADELPETGEASAVESGPSCLYCGGSLPVHRPVNFCPHCGQSQTQILCPECRSEIEPGWRHCVNCGAAVGEG